MDSNSDRDDRDFVDAIPDDDDNDGRNAGGRRGNNADGYQLTNVLKLPRATTYSTQALYDQVVAGDVELEPEYQRDVVWPESKQIGIIDSILRNFYVPPIIFVAHQHEDGSETKTCIDGKQRLTSIHRFMDGLIPHRDPVTGTKYWYKAGAAKKGRGQLLPERYRRLFANKQIVCVEYQDLQDSEEREIFQRVQLGMALTPAGNVRSLRRATLFNLRVSEKLQVLNTPMSAFVRKIQSEYFNLGGPLESEVFDWDRSRGGDFRCITQAFYIIAKYPLSTTIGVVAQLEKWLQHPTAKPYASSKSKKKAIKDEEGQDLAKDDAFLAKIRATFDTFSRLVGDAAFQHFFLKPEWRVAPIEFVMMCLLVSVSKDALTLQALAERMGDMRARVRAEHVDIRMNARVAKTMFDFIQGGAAATQGVKRKHEEEDVAIPERKEKDLRVDQGDAAPTRSQLSTDNPDRPLALRDTKKVIPPPRVTPVKPAFPSPAAPR